MEKEVIWTAQAKDDLRKVYEFNSLALGEEKAYSLIEGLVGKVDVLYQKNTGRYPLYQRPESGNKLSETNLWTLFDFLSGRGDQDLYN